jgi:transcription initiation factor TFIIIB Brf1 subunit/transcription initiation factor TFIIB
MGEKELNMSENKFVCWNCGSSDIYYDKEDAEWICQKCGAIVKSEREIGEAVEEEEEEGRLGGDYLAEDFFEYAEPEDLIDEGFIDEDE